MYSIRNFLSDLFFFWIGLFTNYRTFVLHIKRTLCGAQRAHTIDMKQHTAATIQMMQFLKSTQFYGKGKNCRLSKFVTSLTYSSLLKSL